jgi:uncharacterized protein (TIGR00297 family)
MMAWAEGLLIAVALAGAVRAHEAVSLGGALAGALLAAVLLVQGGGPLLCAFALLVVGGTLASRAGARGRARHGRGGTGAPRGAASALANALPAAVAVLLGRTPEHELFAFAALGGALADTVSGELGQLSASPPRRLLLLERVPAGTDGGMTGFGTLAGLVAAMLAGGLAGSARGTAVDGVAVAAGAFAAALIDSLLGATVQPGVPSRFSNDLTNLLSVTAGGFVALLLARGS